MARQRAERPTTNNPRPPPLAGTVSPTSRASSAAGRAAVDGEAGHVLVAARGSGTLAAGSFFEFATRFAIAFLLARGLGAGDYGLYVLAISAATLFSGVSLLGLDDAMVRYVAILSGRRDAPGVRGTIQIGLGAATAMGVVMGTVLYLGADPIATGLFDEPELARLLRLVALAVPFLSVSNVLAGTARGFHRMGVAALGENVVQSVVRLGLLAVLLLVAELDTTTAVVVFGISDVTATITMITLLNRLFPLDPRGQPVRRDAREVFRFALPLWLSGMLRQFRRNIEALLLGATGSVANVGVFAVVNKVNLVGHVWLLSILVAVKPTMAQLHDRGDRTELARVYKATTRWSLLLALPCVIVMVLYRAPILAAFGPSFTAGSTALVILAMAELVNAGTGTCGPMIDMTGHTRLKLANSVLWTGLLIGGGIVLIPRWGVVGAATASLIAIAAVNVLTVIEVWALERVLPFDRGLWKPLLAGAGSWVTGLALSRMVPFGSALGPAIVQGVVVVAVFAGLTWVFGVTADDRLVLARVWGAITRRGRRTTPRRAAPSAPRRASRRRLPRPGAAVCDRAAASGPVYIGGLDRSGKTTLAAFLTSHPNIDIPDTGSNLWTYFYGRFGDLGRPDNLERCLDLMLRYRHVATLDPDPDRIRREFAAGPPTYARLFSLVHAHHAEREGKPRWGTQTGLVERYADEIFAAYPGVRIIHMVRDPRDRYEGSRALWPRGKGQSGGATARWIYSTRLAERHVRRHPGGYMVVRFEDVVLRTDDTLRQVCHFLGETFHPEMLGMPAAPDRRARLASRLAAPATAVASPAPVVGSELPPVTTQPGPRPPLSPAFVGRFHEHVAAGDVAFIQLHAGRLMRACGYRPVPLAWGTRDWARFITRTWPGQTARLLAWRGREAVEQRFPTRAGRTPDPRLVVPRTLERAR
jgi:O-antigen/teichoic acid export membrane protein